MQGYKSLEYGVLSPDSAEDSCMSLCSPFSFPAPFPYLYNGLHSDGFVSSRCLARQQWLAPAQVHFPDGEKQKQLQFRVESRALEGEGS